MDVATAPVTDRQQAVSTLVMAFSGDPLLRWMFPDPRRYLEGFPRMVEVLGGPSLDAGSGELVDGRSAVALWTEPGATIEDDAMGALMEDHMAPDQIAAMIELGAQTDAYRPPEAWYLPFIGVDPVHQGRGLGSVLLDSGLARIDRENLPVFLDSTTPRSRALYERHGFEVLGEVSAGGSPPVWPMLRPAR